MLYVFTGDRIAAREAVRKVVAICKEKQPNAEYICITDNEEVYTIKELLHSQSLFERKLIVFLNEVDAGAGSGLYENPKEYSDSQHMFIVFNPTMGTKEINLLKKGGAIIKTYKIKTTTQGSSKAFGFAELFLQGNPNKTLRALHTLLAEGESVEPLLAILLWQVRVINAVQMGGTVRDSGVKAYPFKKAQTVLTKLNPTTPLLLLRYMDEKIRQGRLNRMPELNTIEYLILSYTPDMEYIKKELSHA